MEDYDNARYGATPSGYRQILDEHGDNIRKGLVYGGLPVAAAGSYFFLREFIPESWDAFWEAYNHNEGWVAAALIGTSAVLYGLSGRDWHPTVKKHEVGVAGRVLRTAGAGCLILGGIAAIDRLFVDDNNSDAPVEVSTDPEGNEIVITTDVENGNEPIVEYVNEEGSRCEVYLNLNNNQLTPAQQEHVGTHAKYWQEYFYENGGFDQFGATEADGSEVISLQQQERYIDGIFEDESNAAAFYVRTEVHGLAATTPTLDEGFCEDTPFGDCDSDTPDFSRMPQLATDYPAGGSQATGC